jgi:dTMP kinase
MKGRFIAIEGSDGTGKGTQTALLVEYIEKTLQKPVLKLSFPNYGSSSARFVSRYLNGEYGDNPSKIHPDLASFLYAFDRWQSKAKIENFLNDNPDGYVVTDRYVASNLAHQGSKIKDQAGRERFYSDILDLEYNQFAIPRPNLNIVFTLPEKIAQTNVDKKAAREYTAKKRDIHEADLAHLGSANSCFQELCALYSKDFAGIDCYDAKRKQMLEIEKIHRLVIELL